MAAGDARRRGGFSYVPDFSSTTNIHGDGTPAPEGSAEDQARRSNVVRVARR
jgi:hypothetical protein